MGIDKEFNDVLSEISKDEIFDNLEKIKLTEDKGKYFFTCLTEHVFNEYINKDIPDDNVDILKIYVSDLLWKFIKPKFSKYIYRSDISELKNKNPFELYEINKNAADQALFFSSMINNNSNKKVKMKKDVLTFTGKSIYYKLSKDDISKIRNMVDIYNVLYERFENTQNCLNIMSNYYFFAKNNIN
jgi:hypothetical protein